LRIAKASSSVQPMVVRRGNERSLKRLADQLAGRGT
jgi:hypothetical protein